MCIITWRLTGRWVYTACKHRYSQLVAFECSVVQQVEASVVLLGEVDAGHHHQDLNDVPEIFSNGIVEWRVSV